MKPGDRVTHLETGQHMTLIATRGRLPRSGAVFWYTTAIRSGHNPYWLDAELEPAPLPPMLDPALACEVCEFLRVLALGLGRASVPDPDEPWLTGLGALQVAWEVFRKA